MRIGIGNLLLFGGFLVIWHVVFAAFGVYQSKRLTGRWSEMSKIVQATAVGSAGIYLLSVSFAISMVQGLFLPVFFASMAAITVACRLVLRWVLGAVRRRGRNLRCVLIVGTNSRAIASSSSEDSSSRIRTAAPADRCAAW
jgi:FlaA1/EpsC-like NDP-sugar epimerase